MVDVTSPSPIKAGRPTREQALARHNQLLDTALDHFLAKGYESATIEAIAADVSMTKRTVYALYPEKSALFRAAVELAIERYSIAPEVIAATDCGDIAQTFSNIARLRINQVMTPNGLRLQRIINTESYRFPDIFSAYFESSAMPTINFLAELLARETSLGRLAIAEPVKAANVFMSMVVSGPVRIILSGNPISDDDIDERVNFAVSLFLNGANAR